MSNKPEDSNAPQMVGTIIAFIVVGAAILGMRSCGSNENDTASRNNTYPAELVCQNALRRAVNYPRTVRFPFGGHTVHERGGNRARVLQQFSAENAFGVRVDFVGECSVNGNSATVNWTREVR